MAIDSERLDQILPKLACPRCLGSLGRSDGGLTCKACAARYPIHQDRPVLIEDPAGPPRVMSEAHLSNQPPSEFVDWVSKLDGWALNVGAGGTARKLPNCIEMEYSIFRHTDVVGDAHKLPFASESFDAVVTFNTFEHLINPNVAANEIHRVLKPGGRLILHTAFLQPVHEPPYHFYNTTEYGLRNWFRNFHVEDVTVSANFQPGYVLAWLACEIRNAVATNQGEDAGKRFGATTLDEWAAAWSDPARQSGPAWETLKNLPQDTQKRFAAGFQLVATRPKEGAWAEIHHAARSQGHHLRSLASRLKKKTGWF
ncbi:MAG: methyltransferase domain-containing protein [Paludisphaera borealis]|uniref:methyltransferase domain-containing protein n=1 Tax=Paludisphaera borealis TaxID=1387353 RepID=UPI00284B2DBC|nr:methyltransferase domain-containing protein [Paludisphaera borealis]MDR3622072.1 methyltransferase domain-containing protein [Paludisphaera borealis]